MNVEKASKLVNKANVIYLYYNAVSQLLGGNTKVCSIVITGITTVRIVRYIRNISE
jgi:hypothetical protein